MDTFIKDNFKRRFVINLERRSDRLKDFKDNASKYFNPDLIERFNAVDGLTLKKTSKINTGELGCYLSHRKIWETVSKDESLADDDLILVFEDDVFFTKNNFVEKFIDIISYFINNISGNKFLYIGGRFKEDFCPSKTNLEKWKFIGNKLFKRDKKIHKLVDGNDCDRTGHVNIYTKSVAKIFYDVSSKEDIGIAVDHFISKVCSNSEIESYDCFPHLCYSPMNYKTDIQK